MKNALRPLVLFMTLVWPALSAYAQSEPSPDEKATSRQEGDTAKKDRDREEDRQQDKDIKRAVGRTLWAAKEIPENAIKVSVDNGIVRLEGSVDNLIAKRRAGRVAESTRGVIGVSNLIEVWQSNIPDTEIGANVTQALADDPIADAWDVVVQVDNGVVTLKGSADSYAERMAAGEVAMNVKGVRDVRNRIQTSVARAADEELEEKIENRLVWNTRIDADEIEVEVNDGRVELTGGVGSAYAQRLAWQNAWIGGVREVSVDRLEVVPRAGTEGLDEPVSDDAIENAVQLALLQNPRVLPYKPGVSVSVDNNIATLNGAVGNLKARNSAAQTAFDIEGVKSVVNNIAIKPERRVGDAELEKRASRALSRDALLEPGDDVQVEVEDSIATIIGKPDSHFEKMQALDAVTKVEGITGIKDQMTVDYNIPAMTYVYDWDPLAYDFGFDYPLNDGRSDEELAREIAAELRSSPYVDSEEVEVSVNRGVATLNGEVDSWAEYKAAMENALDAGANRVINRLNVEGSS